MKPADLKLLPRDDIDWEELIPAISEANRALARYDGVLYGVPNPGVLLSPLTTQEAVISSRIEGTRTTLDEVFKFEAGESFVDEEREEIREVINYRRALREAEQAVSKKPFNLNLLRELHAILLDEVRGRRQSRGRFRTVQNFIAPPGAGIEEAYYVPPEPSRVMHYMDNWEEYYHSAERDPIVQLAIIHGQFEMIHPFIDGNGRLGRMIIPIFLCEKELLKRPTFYISAYLEANRSQYYELLRALNGSTGWNEWIVFFLTAIAEQARLNTDKAVGILGLYERLKDQILELTRSQYAVPLLDHIFDQPIFSPRQIIERENMPSVPTVMSLLAELKAAGVLQILREPSGRRPQILAMAELINLLEGKRVLP